MAIEQTSFSVDLIGRYICNSWDEAVNSGGAPFDIVVIGAGMHGGYCAEKIYRFAREQAKPIRILVLDAGSVLLTQHEQNYPNINPNPGPAKIVTSNSNDPGPQETVWGYPWRSNQEFPGLAYCIGGRSIYWGGWAPRLTPDDLIDWPPQLASFFPANYNDTEQETGVDPRTDYISGALFQALFDRAKAVRSSVPTVDEIEEAPLAVQGAPPAPG